MELDSSLYDEVVRLGEEGNQRAEGGDYPEAIRLWRRALSVLPPPANDWEAATWLLTSIGDAYFSMSMFADAAESLRDALNCPGAVENPFIYLRLGQSLYRQGKRGDAVDPLLRAYMLEGRDIFHGEPPEFFAYLQSQVDLRLRR